MGVQLAADQPTEGVKLQTHSLPFATARIGLLKTMELRFSGEFRSLNSTVAPSISDTTVSGLASLTVGTKIGIAAEDEAIPELSLQMAIGLPVGSGTFRPASLAPSFAFLLHSTVVPDALNLYANAGAAWDGANPEGLGTNAAALYYNITPAFSTFGEFYGAMAPQLLPTHSFDGGFAYLLNNNLQLDLFGLTPTDIGADAGNFTAIAGTVTLGTNTVAAASINQGTVNAPIYSFSIAAAGANTNLTGLNITTTGTYVSADVTNLKVWYQTGTTFNSGSATLLSTLTTPGVAGTKTFSTFTSQTITAGSTGYIFITADIPCAAITSNTIAVNAVTSSNTTFSAGTVSGTPAAGNTQTIAAVLPVNVTGAAASSETGGDPYFQAALNVVNNAQSSNRPGWQTIGSTRNRYNLVENINNPQMAEMRKGMYRYHRLALDTFDKTPDESRVIALNVLKTVRSVWQIYPSSIYVIAFLEAKNQELANIFSEGALNVRREAYHLLTVIDAKRGSYQKIIENK